MNTGAMCRRSNGAIWLTGRSRTQANAIMSVTRVLVLACG
jgi:hypothetical protein